MPLALDPESIEEFRAVVPEWKGVELTYDAAERAATEFLDGLIEAADKDLRDSDERAGAAELEATRRRLAAADRKRRRNDR